MLTIKGDGVVHVVSRWVAKNPRAPADEGQATTVCGKEITKPLTPSLKPSCARCLLATPPRSPIPAEEF